MSQVRCALAAEAKVETPEGAQTVKSVVGKNVPVFTREQGHIRFRMMRDVQRLAEAQPVLKLSLENGLAFRLGAEQIVIAADGSELRAGELAAGVVLASLCHYPPGYEYLDERAGAKVASIGGWRVAGVEPAGTADLFSFRVEPSECFFVSAGVLCRAA